MALGLTKQQTVMLVIMVFGTFVTVLNQTVVTPAQPSIMTEMAIDASTVQWLTTGFTLVNAIMIPVTAYLTDKHSTKVLYIISMGIFAIGSLLAGIAPNFPVLLVGRLLQAAGAGILMPMVMTVLMLTFPVERRGSAMGIFGVVIAFAPAIGPSVAGLVIDSFGWRILFYAIALLIAIVILISFFALKKAEPLNPSAHLDKLSVVLSTIGFGALLYGFSTIGSVGINLFDGAITLVGVVVLILFFRRQVKMEQPMLNVRVLKNRRFLIGTVIGMIVQASLLAAGVLMPIYLQSYMGYSATVSGLVLMPGAILMGIMNPFAGRLFDKYGPRVLSIVGLIILTISTLGFATLSSSTDVVWLTIIYTIRMFSLSLVNMPITTWAMNALDNKVLNHGTSVNNTLRQVSGSLGTALLVSVDMFVSSTASGSMAPVEAGILGINAAFMTAVVLSAIALLLTILFVKNTPKKAEEVDPDNQQRTMIEKIMKRDVYSLSPDATVVDAMKFFVDHGISGAPVVDAEGKAVGFVSDGDIMRLLSTQSNSYMDPVVMIMQMGVDEETYDQKLSNLMKMNIRDIGTKGVIGIDLYTTLPQVCRILSKNHLKKVPVLHEGKIVGVINRSDITLYSMKTYLEGRDDEDLDREIRIDAAKMQAEKEQRALEEQR
ncbi:MAG TPA: DHA2 family efflux MFS transporter permease subunit [Candidatus Aphodovivens excrementavium]|nr:DHA2 family efflux MFS transporter permease subunit [Candidatus Aphodovivens excrementavium]